MATSLLGNYTDLQAAQIALQGLLEAVCTNPLDTSNLLLEQEISWIKTADDTNATDTTAEFILYQAPTNRRAKLVDATYTTNAAGLNSAATTYATLSLNWRAGTTTGGASGALGTAITTVVTSGGTGNWSQWVPVSFTVNAFDPTNNVVPAGGVVTFNIAKASTGTVVPKGTLRLRLQYV